MSTPKSPAYLISNDGNVTVYMEGQKAPFVASKDHPNYKGILEAIKGRSWKKLPKLFDISNTIEKRGKKALKILDGVVYCDGKQVNNLVTQRILYFLQEDFEFSPLVNFLKKYFNNPECHNEKDVDGLFRFVETNNLVLTWDGFILAYKRVKDDYFDFYASMFDNSIGKTVEMPRSAVTKDPHQTCSAGLHVAGLTYARDHYHSGEGRLIVVKVNPADVVSVPHDYASGKARVCKYVVLEELKDFYKPLSQHDYTPAYAEEDESEEDEDEYPEESE